MNPLHKNVVGFFVEKENSMKAQDKHTMKKKEMPKGKMPMDAKMPRSMGKGEACMDKKASKHW